MTTCTTTTHYATHISAECGLGGSGQCDGFCENHSVECTCSCHTDWDLPSTVAEVRDWHDEDWNIVASVEGTENRDKQRAQEIAAKAQATATQGEHYRVLTGQGRFVVTKEF